MTEPQPESAPKLPVVTHNNSLSGVQRAAVFMLNLEKEDAAEIMRHLGPKQVQRLGLAMAKMKNVDRHTLDDVLTDFLEDAGVQTNLGIDSDDYIRNVITNALGEEKAGGILDRILQGGDTKGLDTLKWMEPKAVYDVIRLEHPQIQSIILSYLDSDMAAEILSHFADRVRLDIMLRISDLQSIQPNALSELNQIMEKRFSGKASSSSRALGGVKTAAEIMNHLDSSIETEIMTEIKERDPDLGQNIQDLMFVFDNFVDVDDRGIQTLLREVSSDTLILALKGADVAVKEKIFANMSKRASELLRDDLEAKGPVKLSEVESAQKEILGIARRMADAGEMVLGRGGEEMI